MRLELCVDSRPFERIRADLAVAGFFHDERPLRGAAGRVDWRLCGLPSRLLRAGQVAGHAREALLLPSAGRLGAERVLLLGLGESGRFDAEEARTVAEDATERAVDLAAQKLALAPLGILPEDFPRCAGLVLDGVLAAVESRRATLALRLSLPADVAVSATRALERAAAGREVPVVIDQPTGLATPGSSPAGTIGRIEPALPVPPTHSPTRY